MTDREIMMSIIELYNSHMVKLCDELLKLEKSMGLKDLQMISGERPSSEVFTALSYEPTIDVGTLKMGTSHTIKVSVKNTGNTTFSLHGLSTFCDCTKATASWKTLSPGKKGDIKIEVTPDAIGDFAREVYIDGNIEFSSSISLAGKATL